MIGRLIVLLGVIATFSTAVDDWMGCSYREFCTRHRQYMLDELETPKETSEYTLDKSTIAFDKNKLSATLTRNGK